MAKALLEGIDGFELVAISDPAPIIDCNCPNLSFEQLVKSADLIIECLPPREIPPLLDLVLQHEKDMIMISASSLLINPEFESRIRTSKSRVIVPSGALAGIDGVSSLKQMGITSVSIASTKKPLAYDGAPFITTNNIDLHNIKEKTRLFSGNAIEAAKGFPANLNVAATLSFAGIGAQKTQVEIWADPDINGNQHEISVEGEFSTIYCRIKNTPDPQNPKSSMLAAQSIISTLKSMSEPLVII